MSTDYLDHAAGLMWDHDCGSVPVVDDKGRLVGMITDRDICMSAYIQGAPLRSLPVANAMARTVCSVHPGDEVAKAEELLRQHQVHRLPVVDVAGRVVGVISLSDIVLQSNRDRAQAAPGVGLDEVVSTIAAVCAPRRPHSLIVVG